LPIIVFFLLSTALACIAMAWLPEIALITAIAWGGILIVSALYLEEKKILLLFLFNLTILLFMAGAHQLLYYLAFFGIAALIMSLLTSRKADYYQIQKVGISAAVLGVSAFLLWSYIYSGGIGINEFEAQLGHSAQESIRIYQQLGIFDAYEQIGISPEEFESSLKRTIEGFARHLPTIYYIQAIIAVFFMLLLASRTAQKLKHERLKNKPFKEERMPWQLVWVAIVGMGLWIWGRDQLNPIYYLGSNILWTLVPIAVYFGLATIVHKIAGRRRSARVLIILGIIFLTLALPLSAIIFLSIIGLFDSLVDFRKLRTGQEE
jgi:uncharacterized protein YybS (DUF2232 family)